MCREAKAFLDAIDYRSRSTFPASRGSLSFSTAAGGASRPSAPDPRRAASAAAPNGPRLGMTAGPAVAGLPPDQLLP